MTRAERRRHDKKSLHRYRNRLSLSFVLSLWTYSIAVWLSPPHLNGMDYKIFWVVPLMTFVWSLLVEIVYCEYELRRIEREIEEERIGANFD